MIQIGDKVCIKNTMGVYSTYIGFFDAYGLSMWKEHYTRYELPKYGIVYTVVGSAPYSGPKWNMIYELQEEGGDIYLSDNEYDSLEVVEIPAKVSPDAFYREIGVSE
jgi:hypothetical protein